MKKSAWLAAMALLPCIAVAAAPEKPGEGAKQQIDGLEEFLHRIDTGKDGSISLEEAKKAGASVLENNFAAIDNNRDGKLSLEEIRAFARKQREDEIGQIKKENKEGFDKIDTNHDGSISIVEAEKAEAPFLANNFAAIDTGKDGQLSLEEVGVFVQALRTQQILRTQKEDAENFRRIDANKDGAISMEEAKTAKAMLLVNNFKAADTSKDGKLSQQEVNALMQAQRMAIARLRAADKDGNGVLSRSEVQGIPSLEKDFDKIDTNHDGQASSQEINAFYSSADKPAPASAKGGKAK